MPGIDTIIQTILDDAKNDAQRAWDEAQRQAAQTREQAKAEADAMRAQAQDEVRRECDDIDRRAHVAASLAMRKANLANRQAQVEKVFAQVREALAGLDDTQYAGMMERLALENAQGGEVIIPAAQGRAISAQSVEAVNAKLTQKGQQPLVLANDSRDIDGGFVLSRDGVEINCSLDSVMRFYRDAMEAEVAEALFAKEA